MSLRGEGFCLVEKLFGGAAADVVDALHRFGIVADARDFERLFGRDEKCFTLGDALVYVVERFVVPYIARFERFINGGMTAQERLQQADFAGREFAVAARACRYYDVALESDRLEILQRNAVGKSAVEISLAVDFDGARDERHRCRSAYPVKCGVVGSIKFSVDWLSGFDIGRDNVKFHRVRLERCDIEDVELLGQFAIAEFRAEKIARRKKRFPRTVARIAGEAFVVADDAPYLAAFVVASEAGSGGDADESVKFDAAFHEYIKNAGRKKPAHRTAFKDKTCF